MMFLWVSEEHLKQYYIDLILPGPGLVVAMVWDSLDVVKLGSILGDFCIQVDRDIIHGSDSVKSAEEEINQWLKPQELVDYMSCPYDWRHK
ncbi:hypothetical protein GH733_000722 [Mirounga leonina]|nr:hypothetical protein GH733_000722 [Mirounga leonina]